MPNTGDLYWNDVALLYNFNGANGSTIFTDLSKNAVTTTRSGNTVISTTQSMFGGSSAYFDGNGDYLTLTANSNWVIGTGDFCLEMWLYAIGPAPLSADTYESYVYGKQGYYTHPALVLDKATIKPEYKDGSTHAAASAAIPTDEWCHVAIDRVSSAFRVYINGTSVLSGTSTKNFSGSDSAIYIGGNGATGYRFYKGYIDSLRLTKRSRYPANFTPPTEEFPTFGFQGMPVKDNSLRKPLKVNGNNFIHRIGI